MTSHASPFEDEDQKGLSGVAGKYVPSMLGTRPTSTMDTSSMRDGRRQSPWLSRVSVGQYALIEEADLVGTMVVLCVNLGSREMGAYRSEALVLGTRHPNSPEDQGQAVPLSAGSSPAPGTPIF